MCTTFLLTPYLNPKFRKRSKSRKISLLPSSLLLNLHLMIEYKGKAPVNTRLNPIGPLEGKLSLAYFNSFVWATLVASGSVWVGRLKSPLAVKGLIAVHDIHKIPLHRINYCFCLKNINVQNLLLVETET